MVDSTYLTLDRLTKTYATSPAVEDFNLSVDQGEMIVLLGPSGCGKTTTLRLIAGFVPATSGRLLIQGRDYTHLPPFRRDFGMVFQSYALFPHMTVAQNVTFGLRMRDLPKAEISHRLEETLAVVKLGHLAARYPRQLSGGQQQRVALARALAIRPKVLLLDEPLSNLDANLRQAVAHEIRKLQRTFGLTTLMVTHDQDEAMLMADRLVLMDAGRIQQVGNQRDLYENPNSPFVARFIGHSNIVEGDLSEGGRFHLPGGHVIRLAGCYSERGPRTLAIRPESIRIAGDGDELDARATVQVDGASYAGSHINYLLRLSDNSTLNLREPLRSTSAASLRPAGSSVQVTWDLNNEYLFSAADGGHRRLLDPRTAPSAALLET